MKFSQRFIILCAVLLIHETLIGQWSWQSPLPQGNDLQQVQFLDSVYGWAVGAYGTIIHTTTGGANWYAQEFGRTDNMLSISMVTGDKGWAAGDNGVILATTDNGDNWAEQFSGVTAGLNSIVFIDTLTGWAAGDNETILHTINGGGSWSVQHQSVIGDNINEITFRNASQGWAVGSNRTLWRTTDGGANWIHQVIGITPSNYLGITFADSSLGFITGSDGVILRTTNAGLNWTEVPSGVAGNLNQVMMQNTFVGWITGDGGTFLKTINGGQSWAATVIDNGENLNSMSRSFNTLWTVGEFGRILKSTNNGFSWSSLDVGSRLSANWMDVISPTTAVTVGQTGLIFRTSDAGNTWNQQPTPTPSISLYGVKFLDQNHGWAIGDNGTILRTTDGGTWLQQSSPTSNTLFGITFGNFSFGWMVGGEFTNYTGTILRTTDGGNSWFVQAAGLPNILYGLSFPNGQYGWAVGENGLITHTTNGGATWNPQTSNTTSFLFWCTFRDTMNGWAVGDNGTVLHTNNGGATWTKQTSGTNVLLYSVTALSLTHVYASGDNGTVLETFDGGAHWHLQYSRTTYSLFAVSAASDASMWACGDYGTIIHYTPPSTGTVSGTVFNDLNNNGIFDPGEPGMPGWKVRLSGLTSDSTITGAQGSYTFSSVPFGSYQLSEASETLWTQTYPESLSYSISLDNIDPATTGDFGNYSTSTYGFPMTASWNMISLPLVTPDPRKGVVYPTAISNAFAFSNGYFNQDTIQPGTGYWLKFSAPQKIWIAGDPIHSDTIALSPGWNLIGGINDSVPTSTIVTDPPNITSDNFYGFQGAYTTSPALKPGQAYWIKSSDAGQLFLNAPAAYIASKRVWPPPEFARLNSLTIKDAKGNQQTLYFGTAHGTSARYELPPLPPSECFDVRFADGTQAAFLPSERNAQSLNLHVQSQNYPLQVSWQLANEESIPYMLGDGTKMIASFSAREGKLTVNNLPKGELVLEPADAAVPAKFRLYQNSPNPFNPATSIRFSLAARSIIRLSIYNVVGQKIATLAEGEYEAGTHDVRWSPSVASGMYFYQLEASSVGSNQHFRETRKMLLLK